MQSNDGILLVDLQTKRFLLTNPSLQQMVGYSEDELLRMSVPDLHPVDELPHVLEQLRKAAQSEITLSSALPVRRKDGTVFFADVSGRPLVVQGHDCVFGFFRDVTERKRTEQALQYSERNYREIFNAANDAIFIHDADTGAILDANDSMLQLFGFTREDVLQLDPNASSLGSSPYSSMEAHQWMAKAITEGPQIFEWQARKKCGELFWVEVALKSATISGQRRILALVRDITERKRAEGEHQKLEAQLRQAAKMESVGRLAGGVAHDFNNMLGVILGHAEMVLDQVDSSSQIHSNLEEIRKAAQRSADLTRQLLAFSRKQTITPHVLDFNATLSSMLVMLRRLIGEDIDLSWNPQTDLWPVRMDPSQIDQIMMNLCVNARDAISGAGKISVASANITLDDRYCAHHNGAVPGDYVMLSVSDEGCGMTKETLSHLFEPFFTTKEQGKGTGLGLATVYGIVKQNDGYIDVISETDKGTAIKIYLPRYTGMGAQVQTNGSSGPVMPVGQTILLVEDQQALLKMAAMTLMSQGYTVLTAKAPDEAIRLAEQQGHKILLLITDVIMPGMNGLDLAKTLLPLLPGLKVLFMSGYSMDLIDHDEILDKGFHFIQKPFALRDFRTRVKDLLRDPEPLTHE